MRVISAEKGALQPLCVAEHIRRDAFPFCLKEVAESINSCGDCAVKLIMRMRYEPNPKHKEPWQPGRKGTLCPKWSLKDVHNLLKESVPDPNSKKRFATVNQLAFAGQQHSEDAWHGYPVPWIEVPHSIRKLWVKERRVDTRSIRAYWRELPPSEAGEL